MSTTTLTQPNGIHVRHVLVIALNTILTLTSLALIASAILDAVSSKTPEPFQADLIPVARNLAVPIPVPTPPTSDILPTPTGTPSIEDGEPLVVPVPVPTPPFS